MKVLVTGGNGFIGSNFILYLQKTNPELEIINLDANLIGSNKKNLLNLKNPDKYQFIEGNINDKSLLEKIIPSVDGIINFAAESHVDRSIIDARPFLESNIMGVYNLLDTIRFINPKCKFLQISTDEVFGSLEKQFAKEDDIFKPSNPYSASKASAEMIVESYKKTYDLNILITRCTNNFGPFQFPEKVIPKTIIRAQRNMKIPVYGSGNNVRDWLYVGDHCKAIFNVFLNGKNGNSYNISGNNELTNIQLIKKILELLGKSENLIYYVEDRPGHDFRYGIDSSKIRNYLGWKPEYTFEEGLKNTIDWYVKNSDWWRQIATEEMLEPTPWKKYHK